jgi:hypothetical protein
LAAAVVAAEHFRPGFSALAAALQTVLKNSVNKQARDEKKPKMPSTKQN